MRRPSARPVLLAVVALVAASCHTIDSGAFAHGPVPHGTLAVREPITYTTGPSSGQLVPAQHGLLGSYFAGAGYERLDHQQIDPNVDFIWDASDTNPVVAGPDGIDHNDGDFRLPDHWPIWSIVWEGYLAVPADGVYGLRLHVNNGGWLEMKDAKGDLTTVVDCAGGSGFEGDCDASASLTAGRQYIRISYFNNAPSVAAAIFSWQPPGSAAFVVVPTTSLFTQVSDATVRRGFIFVHGIKGNFNDRPFRALMAQIEDRTPDPRDPSRSLVHYFQYHQDIGNLLGGVCTDRSLLDVLPFDDKVGYPIGLPVIGEPAHCDSLDDIGVDGLFLEFDIRRLHDEWSALGVQKITIIANSMGGEIVRAYLAYASATRSDPGKVDTLAMIDAVVFMQGVQQGAYGASAREFVDEHPVLQPIREGIRTTVRNATGIDADRPAVAELAPGSDMIRYVNQLDHVPTGLHYLNVRSDIRLHTSVSVFGLLFPMQVNAGDYLILPGDDNPTHTPDAGGAGFLPSVVALGRSAGQWTLNSDPTVPIELAVVQVPVLVLNQPESHVVLGRKMEELCVDTLRGRKRLDRALLDAIAALDAPRPDLDLLNFGNVGSVRCN